MQNVKSVILSLIIFIVAAVVVHFPLAIVSTHLVVSRKIAFPELIIGLCILIYGIARAIGAIRKGRFWLAAACGVLVSFAVALSVVANQVIIAVK